ncbi:MerR family transcriptional regulator [Campylobacter hyointestinalis]|uniref:MerR family transcriptional regulator n=1 Tax=Campylobacter hyointestinalis TaxID=198 RepID=UPI0011AC7DD3|nr:MerR family transcriptional regulator [Campylobacter hyointestinalis]TWO22393.1 MerR family transcriptional regulator [Campylobacter hyointestinalis]
MASTIIEVSRRTGISQYTIRFWITKGLFPFVERDKNGVNYFSEKDIEWASWIECLRSMDMSIADIKAYEKLAYMGITTAKERKEMLKHQQTIIAKKIQKMQNAMQKLDNKIEIYERMIKTGVDELNPVAKSIVLKSINFKSNCNILIKSLCKHK